MSSNTGDSARVRLNNFCQYLNIKAPEYSASTSGPAHQLTYLVEAHIQGTLYGSGTGARQNLAKEAAAAQALEQMHQQYPGHRGLF